MTPVPANATLDAFFLEARSKLLDLAAILDRIGRGAGANGVAEDPRLAKIRQALDVLGDQSGGQGRAYSADFFAQLRFAVEDSAAAVINNWGGDNEQRILGNVGATRGVRLDGEAIATSSTEAA